MRTLNITEICRELRQKATPAEKKLWTYLKDRNFEQFKFRRQHPFSYKRELGKIGFFIADFYCAEKRLVIELDGAVHDFQQYYDANRDEILKQLGLTTLRIKNKELEDMEAVLGKIKGALG